MRYFGRPATSVSPEIDRRGLPLGLLPDEFVSFLTTGKVRPEPSQAANPQLAKLIEELSAFNAEFTKRISDNALGNPVELPNPIGALGPYEGNIARGNVALDAARKQAFTTAAIAGDAITPDALEQIRKTVEGMFPGRRVVMHTDLPTTSADDPKPKGIKPPDRLAWDQWKQMMAEERLPGWSPCKFANRGHHGSAKFVFGIARDQIGMYRMPFDCCLQNEDHTESDMGEKVLTALTHLPTGLGMGLFETQAEAALAVDLMLPVIKDWVALDPDAIGVMEWLLPIQTAWTFGGLAPTDDYHAHHSGSGPLYVWKRSDAAANHGRPEKLS